MSQHHFARSNADLSSRPPAVVEEITRRVVEEYDQAIYMLALAAVATVDMEAHVTLASVATRLRAQRQTWALPRRFSSTA